ncbi:flavodoxin family protein [Bariatricus sp. SGI.154]|uniref:flavodoxin family protein n=1 Tax=Bariatricus sp. SGI.154 TaxID=3420549 RepID=UPI003D0896E4
MKILVLLGSPHKNGTTATLAESSCEGAGAAGHSVDKVHIPRLKVAPCMGCNACQSAKKTCVLKDDMEFLKPKILEADAVIFVSPLYYFGFTAQLKAVIDRFYSINGELRSIPKKAVLVSAGADCDDWAMDGIVANYETMCRYLHWEDCGKVLAFGCGTAESLENTPYAEEAYRLGNTF